MLPVKIFAAFGAVAICGWAQSSAGVAGPVTGFVFDAQAGHLRPMVGIPSAGYLGAPIGAGLAAASVAPDGSAALAVQQGGKLVVYSGLRGQSPAPAAIAGAIPSADQFAWAADGRSAAVYSSKSHQAQTLTGIASSVVAGAPIDLSGLPGQVTALAFDGQRVIAAAAANGTGGVYLVSGSGTVQQLAAAVKPSALIVAGADLYFTDSQSQQIWHIQNYPHAPAALLFADDSGISAPAGLQISADGKRLYVANAGNRTLAVYDMASRTSIQKIALSCTPTRLDLFGSPSVFLLNSPGQGPLFLLRDGGPSHLAVYFVPAPVQRGPRKIVIRPA